MTDELCDLQDGDFLTIQWSGQLRTVAVKLRPDGIWLRDLTEAEMERLVKEASPEWQDTP